MKIPYTNSTPDPEVAIVLDVGKKYNIDEAMLIYTSKIDVKEWVALKCKYGCEKYGKSFCCPPYSLTPEQTKKVLSEYKRALLIASKTKGLEGQAKFREAVIEMEKALFLKNYYKVFSFVPGCCDKCEKCAAEDKKHCRHPMEKRPCIEGTGIDVFSLVRKYKKTMDVVLDKNKEFESYAIILLD